MLSSEASLCGLLSVSLFVGGDGVGGGEGDVGTSRSIASVLSVVVDSC